MLASKWSTIARLPVSAVGGAIYVMVLVGLGLRLRCGKPTRMSNDLLMIGAWSILLAACYYTTIQLVVIKTVCPLCMTTHGVGVALSVIVLFIASSKETIKPNAISLVIAVLGIAILHAGHGVSLNDDAPLRAPNQIGRAHV